MAFLKNQWLTIKAFLDGLPRDTKMLIITLAVFMAVIVFIFMQYAASSSMVPLPQVASDRQDMVLSVFDSSDINSERRGGVIFVSQEKENEALAILAQQGMLKSDTAAAFDKMIERQSPWDTDRQNRQKFQLAKQKVLGQIIEKIPRVRSADVMVSMPEKKGFGETHQRPSASVNVVMEGGGRVSRRLVQAIAGLVAGASTPMEPRDVVVIDANSGRNYTGKREDDISPGDTLEDLVNLENLHKRKIEGVLGYIPGVIVAVNVLTDSMIAQQKKTYEYMTDQPLDSEHSIKRTNKNSADAGAPGARSMTGVSIEGGGNTGSTEDYTEKETNFQSKPLTEEAVTKIVGRTTQEINVTVNVPRTFFVALHKQANPDAQDVDDATLRPIIDAKLAEIEEQVKPIIKSKDQPGVVKASMIPDARMLANLLNPTVEETGMMAALQDGWMRNIGVAALALLSLGVMFTMVRKALQQPQLPTVEELAGIPPQLPGDDELVGEVIEEQGSLMGIEVDDDELRTRNIAEQINDLVKNNPTEAASLLGRWVRTDE